MLEADRIILATPIFFMTVCSQAKVLIDRFQCLWSRKYVLKQPLFSETNTDRRALIIAVGGSKSKKMFESVTWTMKYFLDVLEMRYFANLYVNGIDDKGDILSHPSAMSEAYRLGGELVSSERPVSKKPLNVELYA